MAKSKDAPTPAVLKAIGLERVMLYKEREEEKMTRPDQGKLDKLPKWALDYIKGIEREREQSVRALNQYCDSQTESPFRILEMECTGEQQGPSFKARYVQTNKIEVEWEGVKLHILLRDNEIDLQWEGAHGSISEVAFIPRSFQAAKLKSVANMRG